MRSSRMNRLNTFLLILIFLGIIFILLKEKEAFTNAVYISLDEAYQTPLLKHLSSKNHSKIGTNFTRQGEIDNISSFKQDTNNKYPSIPCDGKAYDGGICKALYQETVKVKTDTANCLPGFDCRRVGFFCSKLG
jgi:cbb3-type cytochrome oxidase subunit 3